ncbi:uncharacterized protein [Haliotis cracherodii]|uniref:uncharacterized protein n=1 Tax=Haliotis cracherodii TaxID=6455 RepID=UPI0039E7F2C9
MATKQSLLCALLCAGCLSTSHTFDIFDEKTNLISLIRASASLDPDVETVGYGNGTVYVRFPGKPMQKIFYFEGFNIARKKRTEKGFNSMSREVFVYRDLDTAEILSVWMNPFTLTANEVFNVANDPIDAEQNFGGTRQTILIPPELVSFNEDIFIQFPNVLDPKNYPKFSSGPIYQGDELFEYYTNMTELASSNASSIKMMGSWFRRGEFLPWMEMGDTPGWLYYHQAFWKLVHGFDDVAPDLAKYVEDNYPQYMHAPTTFTNKMVTSWDVFKKAIDARRAKGDPDIIIPQVNIQSNLESKSNSLDSKIVQAALKRGQFRVYFNGSVFSEITGNGSVHLFNFDGHVQLKVLGLGVDSYKVHVEISGLYYDPITGKVLDYFVNPIVGKTQKVENFFYSAIAEIPMSSVFSYPLPGMDLQTVLFHESHSVVFPDTRPEDWAINMVSMFVEDAQLDQESPYVYGTWVRFSSWLPWFQMDSIPGDMVWRVNFYKTEDDPTM